MVPDNFLQNQCHGKSSLTAITKTSTGRSIHYEFGLDLSGGDKNPSLDRYLIHNSKSIPWDMRFFPIAKNEFRAIRQGGADGVLKFTKLENGVTKLEMIQYGKVIGTSFKKAANKETN